MSTRHYESSGVVNESPARVFAHLDDQSRLSAHMRRRSWKMGGARMEITTDARRGQSVGSRIQLRARVLGIRLGVEGVVTDREPPLRKAWATVGEPQLLVIGPYRMGFDLAPHSSGSALRVWIDYELPAHGLARWLGRLFGDYYARWCTRQMVADATAHFATAAGGLSEAASVAAVRPPAVSRR